MRSARVRLLFVVILAAHVLSVSSQSQQQQQQQSQSQTPQRQAARRRPNARINGRPTHRPTANGDFVAESPAPQQQRTRPGRSGSRRAPMSSSNSNGLAAGPNARRNVMYRDRPIAVPNPMPFREQRPDSQGRGPARAMSPMSLVLTDPDEPFGEQRCVPKPAQLSFCTNIGYDKLRLPNRFQHYSLDEIVENLQQWRPLVASSSVCHESALVSFPSVVPPDF